MGTLERTLHDARKLAVTFIFSCEEILRNQDYLIDFSREVMGKIQDNPFNGRLFFALSAMEKSLCAQKAAIIEATGCCREISDTIERMDEGYSGIHALREELNEVSRLMSESSALVNADFESMDILQWESSNLYREECQRYREKCASAVSGIEKVLEKLM